MKSMCCLCIQFTHENTSERTNLIWLLALQKGLATPLIGTYLLCDYVGTYLLCDYVGTYLLCDYVGTYLLSDYVGTYLLCDYVGTYLLCDYVGTYLLCDYVGTYLFSFMNDFFVCTFEEYIMLHHKTTGSPKNCINFD